MAFNFFLPEMHQRPKLACDLMPDGVVAARPTEAGHPATAFAPLFAGALVPGLKTPNVMDKNAVVAALKRALDAVEGRDKRLTLHYSRCSCARFSWRWTSRDYASGTS